MKLLATLAASLLLITGTAHAGAKVGEAAPAFTTTDSNGKSVSLADFKGKLVVLEWTNDGCPFVKKHYSGGNMQGLQKDAAAKGVVWLSIISSAPGKQGHLNGARANELTQSRGAAPAHVLLDESGAVGRLYEAKATPHMYLVGRDGMLIYAGGIDSNASADPADIAGATPYLRLALDEALAGKAVSQPVTRPYGCSVKY